MPAQELILVSEFCAYHRVEVDFVNSLEQRGLIETTLVEQSVYLQPDQLGQLEKLIRLRQELDIHVDDLDLIVHLLERLESLQEQVTWLRNRLIFYEPPSDRAV
ncbi:MAG: chaperone modulator CbpM [Rudanella sp.]|nr:chaperone modulator CbpM [Rudanella sp.]